MTLYRQAGAAYAVPWPVLAAIGAIESDHGRSTAPGVHSGVNAFGCCAGPMQVNVANGPPSTWQSYATDGNHDGKKDPYSAADAIASAARYLRVLLDGARGNIARAVFGYNHSPAYVQDVLARTRAYSSRPETALIAPASDCSPGAGFAAGPGNLRTAERRESRAGRARQRGGVGRVGRRAGAGSRLDVDVWRVGFATRVCARPGDSVRRIRGVSRPRIATDVQRQMLRPPTHLVAFSVLRHRRPVGALCLGHRVRGELEPRIATTRRVD